MAMPIFKSFWSTVQIWRPSAWRQEYKIITDNNTGAPIGLLSMNANGPDGIWAPVPLSASQIASPAATILADLNATYQLNVAPYTRYYSDGDSLVPFDPSGEIVIPAGVNEVWFSPLIVTEGHSVTVEGGLRLIE